MQVTILKERLNIVFLFNDIEYKMFHVTCMLYFEMFLEKVEIALYNAMFKLHNTKAREKDVLKLIKYKTDDETISIIDISDGNTDQFKNNYKYWRKIKINMYHKNRSCSEEIFWTAMELLNQYITNREFP